jgi:deazaflavin-dependent oxidoreductase (nitroreductase family)
VTDLDDVANETFCYLTTQGRVTGEPHEIEIWFAARASTIYLLSGGGSSSDWVKNVAAHPNVRVRVGATELEGRARVAGDPDEEAWARQALFEKYDPTYAGDLTKWSETALPVAIDIT